MRTTAYRYSRAGAAALLAALAAFLATCSVAAAAGRDDWQQPDRVVSDFGLEPGAAVADVGCGDGYFTFRLARAVGDAGKVFAVDIDSKALKKVRDRAAKEQLERVEVIHSEPTNTRLADAAADVALLSDVLHHVPAEQRPALVKDIVRALKPGGFLFIIDWRKSRDVKFDPYEILIPRDDLLKLGADAGLALDAEFHYLKFQVFLRFRKAPNP